MKKIILSLVLLAFAFASCQEKATQLSLNLEQGKEHKQKTDNKTTVIQNFNGQEINMTMNIKGNMSYLVTSVSDEAYNMDVKYESLSMTMQMPQGMNVEFNSESNDPNDFFSAMFKAMIGEPFQVVMARNGKVVEVKNIEALFDAAIAQFDKFEIGEAEKEQVMMQLKKAYGAEAFKGSIEMVTAIFSDSPVKIGDKWKIDTKLEAGMSANMSSEYELVELAADHSLIKGNSTIVTEDKEAYMPVGGMEAKYDLTGSRTSEIKVDKNTGWIIEAKIDDTLNGQVVMKGNEQMPDGLTIPMTMINKTVITN